MTCRSAVPMLLISVNSCVAPVPPAPLAPRPALEVAAPFSRTWDAAIDHFATNNIQIKTIDRASGILVAEPMTTSGTLFADCGRTMLDMPIVPTHATWNLLVRGDSVKSTVKATIRFVAISTGRYGSTTECTSKGVWESGFEQEIKTRAEKTP